MAVQGVATEIVNSRRRVPRGDYSKPLATNSTRAIGYATNKSSDIIEIYIYEKWLKVTETKTAESISWQVAHYVQDIPLLFLLRARNR